MTGCKDPSPVFLAVQLYNSGNAASRKDIPVSVYAVDGELLDLISTHTWPDSIGPGVATEPMTIELQVGDFGPDGIAVRVDDNGSGGGRQVECDETNNTDEWGGVVCPQ